MIQPPPILVDRPRERFRRRDHAGAGISGIIVINAEFRAFLLEHFRARRNLSLSSIRWRTTFREANNPTGETDSWRAWEAIGLGRAAAKSGGSAANEAGEGGTPHFQRSAFDRLHLACQIHSRHAGQYKPLGKTRQAQISFFLAFCLTRWSLVPAFQAVVIALLWMEDRRMARRRLGGAIGRGLPRFGA